ncbi:hypothetical protein FBY35_7022 [Streptomyces sp. SLBN-118]|nr:hypothetical protein FBY35_7022 [Streptomyces sp. SLBN-118]
MMGWKILPAYCLKGGGVHHAMLGIVRHHNLGFGGEHNSCGAHQKAPDPGRAAVVIAELVARDVPLLHERHRARLASWPGKRAIGVGGKHRLVSVDRTLDEVVGHLGASGRTGTVDGAEIRRRMPWCSQIKPGSCADVTHACWLGLVKLLADGLRSGSLPMPPTRAVYERVGRPSHRDPGSDESDPGGRRPATRASPPNPSHMVRLTAGLS